MTYKIKHLFNQIHTQVLRENPREACGVITKYKDIIGYIECTNIAEGTENFIIDPIEYADLEDLGHDILYIVHSHPDGDLTPSEADLRGVEQTQLPWLIMNLNKEINILKPSSILLPLEGRIFEYGTTDCYTLICDYYKNKYNIVVEDFERPDGDWWKTYGTQYESLYSNAGFIRVENLSEAKADDLLVMSKYLTDDPDHYAIYLGNNKILHHAVGRLSCIESLSGEYTKSIRLVLRRKELM